MPYLLPADPDVEELGCVLIAFPNAPEYRQALFGQLAELTDVWNWQGTREQQAIARRVWLAAERETLDAMNCLDEILAVLEEIRDKPCCPSGSILPPPTIDGVGWDPTGLPDDIPTDDVTIGVGDPPLTEWTDPEGAGITWVDYQNYLCGAANVYLDGMLAVARLLDLVSTGLLGISQLASYYFDTIVDLLGIDVPLWLNSDLLLYLNALEGDWAAESWGDIIDDIGEARTDLVCAISQATNATSAASALLTELGNLGLSAPVIAVLGFPASMMNVLFQGGIRADYAECECVEPPDWAYNLDCTGPSLPFPWQLLNFTYDASNDRLVFSGTTGTLSMKHAGLRQDYGYSPGAVVRVTKLQFDSYRTESATSNLGVNVDDIARLSDPNRPLQVWETIILDPSAWPNITLENDTSSNLVQILASRKYITNVIIEGDLISP